MISYLLSSKIVIFDRSPTRLFKNMETVLIQIKNNKAYRILEDLEDLQVIKVLEKKASPKESLSEKYAGKLPSEVADQLQEYLTKSRKEWDNRNI